MKRSDPLIKIDPPARYIPVAHLLRACEGDPERLAGLAVLISLASSSLVMVTGKHDQALITAQLEMWNAAIAEIQQLCARAHAH